MRILFFDTETTGGGETDRLIQLAIKEYGVPEPLLNALYKPPVPITLDSMAVHHITEKMVADKPSFIRSPDYVRVKELFEDPDTVSVAHNVPFDLSMLAREDIHPANAICTIKVAVALDPEEKIASYRLQYLRYLLGLEVEAGAHDAWDDVLVLEALFARLLAKMIETHGSEDAAVEVMIEISKRPRYFRRFKFGKYVDRQVEDVAKSDPDYLRWLLKEKQKNPALEADWIATLKKALGGSPL